MSSIRLPNGKIMINVPDDATKEEIVQAAIASGQATPEDFGINISEMPENLNPANNVGAAESFAIGAGRGMTNFARGAANLFGDLIGAESNLFDSEDDLVKKAMSQLKERNPISTGVGEIAGEVAPALLLPFGAAAGATTKAAQYGGTALLGATEGAIIARGQDGNVAQGAALGAGGASLGLYLSPIIERGMRKLANRLGFSTKQAIDPNTGQPTPEFAQELANNNITADDILDIAGVENIKNRNEAPNTIYRAFTGFPVCFK